MLKLRNKFIFVILFLVIIQSCLFAQSIDWKGMLFGWLTANFTDSTQAQLGIRYIPELSFTFPRGDSSSWDVALSFSAFGTSLFQSGRTDTDADADLYRFWLRYATSQFEVRMGLQKINFGPAALFRPLMWFDRIDPRDPLQVTKGVYALLGRYYFLNNANVWAWILYGNEETKGWEVIGTADDSVEYGGRIQVPLLHGELAFTYHHRNADLYKSPYFFIPEIDPIIPENRFALDGKWDIGVGFWFEGVLIHQNSGVLPFPYRHLLTIGADYTFDLGNGLHALAEHFIVENSARAFKSGEGTEFSGISLNYPASLLDSLSGILFYDWDERNLYRYISWQRTYDKWRIYLIGFWNPEQFRIYQTPSTHTLFGGKGIQIMVVFNH